MSYDPYYLPRYKHYRDPGRKMHTGVAGAWLGAVVVVLVLLAIPVVSFVTAHMNNRVQVITVTSKDDQPAGKSHQYLIFTPQGVFKDTDNFWLGKWNSSDLYNELQPGHTYRCNVHGTRNHVTSNYPDLMSCKLLH